MACQLLTGHFPESSLPPQFLVMETPEEIPEGVKG
jgi:hypothetical protein